MVSGLCAPRSVGEVRCDLSAEQTAQVIMIRIGWLRGEEGPWIVKLEIGQAVLKPYE
jgi:hypothetical protein